MTLIVGCKKMQITSQWKPESLKVDGNGSDWGEIPLMLSEKLNGIMGAANDAENQYLIFKFSDQRLARRIQRMGLTVWINTFGKKNKEFGIRYTGSEVLTSSLRSQRGLENQREKFSQFDKMKKMKNENLPKPGMVGVIQNGKVSMEPEKNPWGPTAASAENEGVYCYEFKIPLQFDKSITDDQVEIANDKIKVCLEIGGITDEMRNQMKGQMSGKRGGGGRSGGMRGGGMRSGGRSSGRSGTRMPGGEGFEKKEIWLDVVLAEKVM